MLYTSQYICLTSVAWWVRYMFSLLDKSWYLNERCCSVRGFALCHQWLSLFRALFQTRSKLLAKWSHGGHTSENVIKQSGCPLRQECGFIFNKISEHSSDSQAANRRHFLNVDLKLIYFCHVHFTVAYWFDGRSILATCIALEKVV